MGFFARPIGGIVIGHYGDKVGRKSMLVLTLVIMGVATFLIGLLPTYEQIGPWAAVALVVLRVAQGFGVGGEWGGAVLMAVEHAPPGARVLRQLAADRRPGRPAAVDGGVRRVLAAARGTVPVLGLARAVPAQHRARRRRPDHPLRDRRDAGVRESRKAARRRGSRSSRCFARYPKKVLLAMGARFAENGAFYIYSVFVLTYATQQREDRPQQTGPQRDPPRRRRELVAIPFFGALSDRLGRRPVYLFGAVMTAVLAYPLFWLLDRLDA